MSCGAWSMGLTAATCGMWSGLLASVTRWPGSSSFLPPECGGTRGAVGGMLARLRFLQSPSEGARRDPLRAGGAAAGWLCVGP